MMMTCSLPDGRRSAIKAVNAEKDAMSEREQMQTELDQLERELAEAWWYEAPLDRIESLEREIRFRQRRIREREGSCHA